MTAYPIPTHLKPFLTPLGEKNSELSVTGVIRCKCGHLLFTPYANEAGTVAAAKCRSCGSKILLFHAGRHGWDGFVAKAGYLYDLSGRLTAMDTCPHCRQKTAFGLRVSITSAGRQDFIDESELTDEDGNDIELEYVDALELDGQTYMAFFPVVEDDADEEAAEEYGLVILKSVMENGEELLSTLDSDEELDKVYDLFMEQILADEDE